MLGIMTSKEIITVN